MYKLVAVDMDGTLLNDEKHISSENLKAIKNARSLGVKVVLASGRPVEGLSKYIDKLGLNTEEDFVIAYNGALIQNIGTGEIISKDYMTIEDLQYLFHLSRELEVNIHFLNGEKCITHKMNKYSTLEATMNGIPVVEQDFNTISPDNTIVKVMFIDEPKILDRVVNNLPKDIYEKYSILRSEPFYLEFLNKTVTKGYGVEQLAKILNISREDIICIGDAGNDLHMIEYAGLGVAMGNAFPELKEIADYVTKTNEEHGVAHVIEKFILNKAC